MYWPSDKPDRSTEPDFDDVVAPEKKDLNKAALDAELAKAVAKNLITKSMPKAKRNQILGRQDLVEKEAIKQLKEKINQLKEDKKNLQKVLLTLHFLGASCNGVWWLEIVV